MAATAGLELEVGGQRGTVVELRPAGAVVRIGSARVEVAYGTRVLAGGKAVALVAAQSSALSPAAQAIEDALRAWRSSKAKEEKVPAYVVLKDADLQGMAERAPASLAELAQCHGIGPLRLERYGDEILEVIEAAGQRAQVG